MAKYGPRPKPLTKERIMNMSVPEPNSGCWLWLATGTKKGYGFIKSDGRVHLAHRASYMVFKGDITDEVIMHTCNNPSCVNPEHLVQGTYSQNTSQMFREGRNHNNNHNHRGYHGRYAKRSSENG